MDQTKVEDISEHQKKHGGGPRTDAGKLRSSRNSLKHGIFAKIETLPEEQAGQFEELWEAFREEKKPVGVIEECLCRRMAEAQWRLGRVLNAETDAIKKAREKNETAEKSMALLGRYSGGLTREYQTVTKNLNEEQAPRLLHFSQEWRQAVLIRDYYRRQGVDWDPADDEFVFSKELIDQQLRFNGQWDKVCRNIHIFATTKYQDERYSKKAL